MAAPIPSVRPGVSPYRPLASWPADDAPLLPKIDWSVTVSRMRGYERRKEGTRQAEAQAQGRAEAGIASGSGGGDGMVSGEKKQQVETSAKAAAETVAPTRAGVHHLAATAVAAAGAGLLDAGRAETQSEEAAAKAALPRRSPRDKGKGKDKVIQSDWAAAQARIADLARVKARRTAAAAEAAAGDVGQAVSAGEAVRSVERETRAELVPQEVLAAAASRPGKRPRTASPPPARSAASPRPSPANPTGPEPSRDPEPITQATPFPAPGLRAANDDLSAAPTALFRSVSPPATSPLPPASSPRAIDDEDDGDDKAKIREAAAAAAEEDLEERPTSRKRSRKTNKEEEEVLASSPPARSVRPTDSATPLSPSPPPPAAKMPQPDPTPHGDDVVEMRVEPEPPLRPAAESDLPSCAQDRDRSPSREREWDAAGEVLVESSPVEQAPASFVRSGGGTNRAGTASPAPSGTERARLAAAVAVKVVPVQPETALEAKRIWRLEPRVFDLGLWCEAQGIDVLS